MVLGKVLGVNAAVVQPIRNTNPSAPLLSKAARRVDPYHSTGFHKVAKHLADSLE